MRSVCEQKDGAADAKFVLTRQSQPPSESLCAALQMMSIEMLVSIAQVLLTCPHCSFPRCAVDLPFPENTTHPVLRAGPNAIALYRGHSSSFVPGKMLLEIGLLDAFVYTSNEEPDPKLLQTLTPGRPAFLEKR